MALALALVNDPTLLFLDEPTTRLDPQVRLEIHGLIGELRDAQRTILLTTHYIEEAERSCDQVAIVDQGKIIALGTPRDSGADAGHLPIVCHTGDARDVADALDAGVDGQRETAARGRSNGADKKGYQANLLLVDGNPLQDISSTERISAVFFQGERLDRKELFDEP